MSDQDLSQISNNLQNLTQTEVSILLSVKGLEVKMSGVEEALKTVIERMENIPTQAEYSALERRVVTLEQWKQENITRQAGTNNRWLTHLPAFLAIVVAVIALFFKA